jgi:hypothetical protein
MAIKMDDLEHMTNQHQQTLKNQNSPNPFSYNSPKIERTNKANDIFDVKAKMTDVETNFRNKDALSNEKHSKLKNEILKLANRMRLAEEGLKLFEGMNTNLAKNIKNFHDLVIVYKRDIHKELTAVHED